MDRWNWTAFGTLSALILALGRILSDMVSKLRTDLAATSEALKLHVVEDKAVADDVKDLKVEVASMREAIHRIDTNTSMIKTIVERADRATVPR